MANFETSYAIVRANEGGYANNALDKGGETYKGIARKAWPSWPGWSIVDSYRKINNFPKVLDSVNELQSLVHSFFKTQFWDALNLDSVQSQALATELFDTGVNMGASVSGVFLQRALNLTSIYKGKVIYQDLEVDGKIGPKTISVLNSHPNTAIVFKTLNILQGAKYVAICESDKSQRVFFYGWLERVQNEM